LSCKYTRGLQAIKRRAVGGNGNVQRIGGRKEDSHRRQKRKKGRIGSRTSREKGMRGHRARARKRCCSGVRRKKILGPIWHGNRKSGIIGEKKKGKGKIERGSERSTGPESRAKGQKVSSRARGASSSDCKKGGGRKCREQKGTYWGRWSSNSFSSGKTRLTVRSSKKEDR